MSNNSEEEIEVLEGVSFTLPREIGMQINTLYDSEQWQVLLLPFSYVKERHPKYPGLWFSYDVFHIFVSIVPETNNSAIGAGANNNKVGLSFKIVFYPDRILSGKYDKTNVQTEEEGKKLKISLLKNFKTTFLNLLKQSLQQSQQTRPIHIENLQVEINNYVKNLNIYDELCLLQYSAFGDELVNSYLRGTLNYYVNDIFARWQQSNQKQITHIFPLTAQLRKLGLYTKQTIPTNNDSWISWLENPNNDEVTQKMQNNTLYISFEDIEKCCKQFAEDLTKIIAGAPKLPFDYVVFRGLTNKPSESEGFEKGFLSTSIDSSIAKKFTIREIDYCCLMIIHVPKDTPFLLIPKSASFRKAEGEVLFPPNTKLEPLSKKRLVFNGIESYEYQMKYSSGGRRRTKKTKQKRRKTRKA